MNGGKDRKEKKTFCMQYASLKLRSSSRLSPLTH